MNKPTVMVGLAVTCLFLAATGFYCYTHRSWYSRLSTTNLMGAARSFGCVYRKTPTMADVYDALPGDDADRREYWDLANSKELWLEVQEIKPGSKASYPSFRLIYHGSFPPPEWSRAAEITNLDDWCAHFNTSAAKKGIEAARAKRGAATTR
jgi:hypothetical protein